MYRQQMEFRQILTEFQLPNAKKGAKIVFSFIGYKKHSHYDAQNQ
jgi:hypothetical protein